MGGGGVVFGGFELSEDILEFMVGHFWRDWLWYSEQVGVRCDVGNRRQGFAA